MLLGFYGWFFWQFGSAFLETPRFVAALPLLAEGVTVFFLLIRRPAATIAPSPVAWLLAWLATLTPLLILPIKRADEALFDWSVLGGPLILAGLAGALVGKLALGRSFGLVAAHRGLQFAGPYRIVRHPIYTCYLLSHVGMWLLNPTLWNLGVYAVAWGAQIPRLLVEEKHLSQDASYREYQKSVRYRLVPGLF